jgi:hypothetical protein
MTRYPESFSTGELVPASGIYSVAHAPHRLFAEVAMFKGEVFPRCASCSDLVTFRLLREFNGLDASGTPSFRIPLYELAEIEPVSSPLSAT